ncbi:antiviral reverse transcriptase Drt3a [Vibrio anguillarum]|uniref:antiviral reverse transcriptase Drt3a n=1 Tax=Vibrio anguillarum TaxID=55601 RepID=UPI0002EA4A62|nr:antiviral reverse transcriptase Drt3a [Vibrio anguillarum]OEE34528.1 hypothetical protein A1QW_09530 [Vibrio anguillarum]OEF92633.1 hypothetical protein A1QY_17900 [Vibrio anguillarum]
MSELAYIPRHFRKCVKYKNLIKVDDFKDNVKLTHSCSQAYQKVKIGQEWSNAIDTILVKNKKAYILKTPESILVNNLVINNISSKYRTKCIDRDVTIRLITSHIRDSYAFTIHRLDVKSFYESFDRRTIINKLKSDAKLSRKTLSTLEKLFHELNSLNVDGLPRGMGISATLSELMMNDFDDTLRASKGVLFYSRFVDDIIIITTPHITKNKLNDIISTSSIPKNLEFHSSGSKVAYKMIGKTTENSEKVEIFEFLGYQFKILLNEQDVGQHLNVRRRLLDVEIADEKITKIKLRIIKSFCKFISSKKPREEKLSLLIKRLNFLSKNYPLINATDNSQVLSGIYFNYKHVSNPEKLHEVDLFYKSLLFSNKSNLSKRIKNNFTYKERYILSRISFLDGFKEKRFCKFSYKDFKEIKAAWV